MVPFYSVVFTMGNSRVSNRDILEAVGEIRDIAIENRTDIKWLKEESQRRFTWLEDEADENMVARERLESHLDGHKETKAYKFSIASIVLSISSVIAQLLGL